MRDVKIRTAAPPVEGQVAFLPEVRTVNGTLDVVMLNRGTEHGLTVGSPLEVYRTTGQAKDPQTGMTRALPDDVYAQAVVTSAEPTSAVAVVPHAREELERGDRFRGTTAR